MYSPQKRGERRETYSQKQSRLPLNINYDREGRPPDPGRKHAVNTSL